MKKKTLMYALLCTICAGAVAGCGSSATLESENTEITLDTEAFSQEQMTEAEEETEAVESTEMTVEETEVEDDTVKAIQEDVQEVFELRRTPCSEEYMWDCGLTMEDFSLGTSIERPYGYDNYAEMVQSGKDYGNWLVTMEEESFAEDISPIDPDYMNWKSARGIGLGSTAEDVVHAYGEKYWYAEDTWSGFNTKEHKRTASLMWSICNIDKTKQDDHALLRNIFYTLNLSSISLSSCTISSLMRPLFVAACILL